MKTVLYDQPGGMFGYNLRVSHLEDDKCSLSKVIAIVYYFPLFWLNFKINSGRETCKISRYESNPADPGLCRNYYSFCGKTHACDVINKQHAILLVEWTSCLEKIFQLLQMAAHLRLG